MLFEYHKYDRSLHRTGPACVSSPYNPISGLQKASFLYWAEHCIECAAPYCYQTCDLYEPRADLRCRRFAFGAFKNKNFRSLRGHGVEITFKKWAKMEAYGNLRLHPLKLVMFAERLVEWTGPVADVIGKLMGRLTKKPRWRTVTHLALEEVVHRLNETRSRKVLPDAFLLEVYNPEKSVIRMQLSFTSLPASSAKVPLVTLSPSFRETVVCQPGYLRWQVSSAELRSVIDAGPFLVSFTPEADQEARLVFLCADFVKFSAKNAPQGGDPIKCVVFDLDNTLWQGILTEGDEVTVQPDVLRLLKLLDERGILLSIASKNDHEAAWGKIRQLGLDEYFLYPQINWNPKSQNIKTIANRLNIGIDAVAFIDDNPFELDEVSGACQEVLCINASEIPSLFKDSRLEGSTTSDAIRRRQLYRDAQSREAAEKSFGRDYMEFLAACEIHLEIWPFIPEDSERVTELVQRTNQLNFSGHKHTRHELAEIFSNPQLEKLVLKSHDRYGSYGTIGFCIVQRTIDTILIRDLMLSCRVQGKLLEKALFYHLLSDHGADSLTRLWINFHKTDRNTPAQKTLECLGFRACEPPSQQFGIGMLLDTASSLSCEIIRVKCACHPEQAQMSPERLETQA